jgi:hypothetical protein
MGDLCPYRTVTVDCTKCLRSYFEHALISAEQCGWLRFRMLEIQADDRRALDGVRTPRMNSIMERWIQSSRNKLLDRTPLWIRRTCCTPCASRNATTTGTVLMGYREHPTPLILYLNRSPIPRHSRVYVSADTISSADSRTNTILPLDQRGRAFAAPAPLQSLGELSVVSGITSALDAIRVADAENLVRPGHGGLDHRHEIAPR